MLTITRIHARIRRTAAGDAGVSLIELVVGMALATIVGAMTLATFVGANDAVNTTTDRLVGTANARNTLQTWQSLIQVADSPQTMNTCSTGSTQHRFEWLTSTEVLFYANLSNRKPDGTCLPPQLIWLALRNGNLLEARYTITQAATSYVQSVCRTLSQSPGATITAATLFSPNPGQALFAVNFGSAFAQASPFASATGCSSVPTSVAVATVSNSDPTANNALAQVNSVGIDFIVADETGQHTQSFDTIVAVNGGTGS